MTCLGLISMWAKKQIGWVGCILNPISNQQRGPKICCLAQQRTWYLALLPQILTRLPLSLGYNLTHKQNLPFWKSVFLLTVPPLPPFKPLIPSPHCSNPNTADRQTWSELLDAINTLSWDDKKLVVFANESHQNIVTLQSQITFLTMENQNQCKRLPLTRTKTYALWLWSMGNHCCKLQGRRLTQEARQLRLQETIVWLQLKGFKSRGRLFLLPSMLSRLQKVERV